MKDKWKDIPWTKKEIYANFIALLTTIILGTISLLIMNWGYVLLFWVFWILYAVVGRYVTCRHCDFLGKPCPSWFMGIIGGKLYKRSEKKCFPEAGIWKMIIFDVSFLVGATLLPIIIYILSFLTKGFLMTDAIIIFIYGIVGLITLSIHSKFGCSKCPIEQCPLCGKKSN